MAKPASRVADPTYRDDASLHEQLTRERAIPDGHTAYWLALNDELEQRHLPPYPPLWAFRSFGGCLSDTPALPFQLGFQPQPISEQDRLELKLLLAYERQPENSDPPSAQCPAAK